MNALEMVIGIVAVGRIASDFGYLQDAGWRRHLFAPNRRGVKGDQHIRLVEQLDGLAGLVDLDPVGLGGIRSLSAARVDDDDFVCGAIEMLACLSGQNGRSSKLQATHGWSPPDRRFRLVGDIFGLENGGTHRFTAEAVVKTTVRLIKRQSLEAVAESDAVVSRNLLSMTTSNLEHAENQCSCWAAKLRWKGSPRFCLKWTGG